MSTTLTVSYSRHGKPQEVAYNEEQTLPAVGEKQVRIEIKLAPINPSDINTLEGTYAQLPELPAVGGREAVGVVVEIGSAVKDLKVGQLVEPPPALGAWRQQVVADADKVLPFPEGLSVEQAAVLSVNPATARLMLTEFVDLKPGDFVIQNAANSGVGRSVIEIAKARGLKTINLVRREELIAELKALGADHVLLDDDTLRHKLKEVTGGAPIKLALNTVGGDSAFRLTFTLAQGGIMVTYGGMSKQPIRLGTGLLIFKDIQLRGFWVTRWYKKASREQVLTLWEELGALARKGAFRLPIEKRYPLTEFKQALEHAQQSSRGGKIVFQPNP
jgi:mitochondrial enoyl-[acyl-carrier protein] reductase / trans-2-enoyl-CoA reductase